MRKLIRGESSGWATAVVQAWLAFVLQFGCRAIMLLDCDAASTGRLYSIAVASAQQTQVLVLQRCPLPQVAGARSIQQPASSLKPVAFFALCASCRQHCLSAFSQRIIGRFCAPPVGTVPPRQRCYCFLLQPSRQLALPSIPPSS